MRFRTHSNKKACAKSSLVHVVPNNTVRYASGKEVLTSCDLSTLATLRRKCLNEDKITSSHKYRNELFSYSVREVHFPARSNKKACPKLSLSQVVSKNCVRYSIEKVIFRHTLLEVPLSFPAQKRECDIFGPGMTKNSIRTKGIKLTSPHLVFATLALGSGDNFLKVWADQVFSSWDA